MRNLSFGDLVDVASEVAEELRICEESIAVSESAAGGLVNASLVAVPGASDFYLGGMVVYTSAGRALLAQNDPLPKGLRGATEAFAFEQARRAKSIYGADWGLGETGATGPSSNPYGDPPGSGWVACSGRDEASFSLNTGVNERSLNMLEFAIAALELALRSIRA